MCRTLQQGVSTLGAAATEQSPLETPALLATIATFSCLDFDKISSPSIEIWNDQLTRCKILTWLLQSVPGNDIDSS
jgi:hypothetical protein